MKKIILFLILAVSSLASWAYDFSAVAPSGQTLYYKISGSTVSVTSPGSSSGSWSGYTQPTGSLTIPSSVTYSGTTYSVTSIGSYAFNGCSGLTTVTIPNSVTSIVSSAFYNCSGLTSVTIPNSVTSIGNYAFYYCSGLTSIIVDANNNRYDSRNNCNAVIETASNTLVIGCQNTTIPNSVTSIGSYAFNGCSGLTSVTIPNSVTSIGNYAFQYCSGLTSVTIPNSVTSIGDNAFFDCSGLTSVTIPNSVTSISDNAFFGCCGLTSVTIPNSVTSIRSYAFRNCSGLTSVTIPNSVTSISSSAFYGCSGLTSIIVDANNNSYDSRNNCNAVIGTTSNTLILGCKNTTIPNSVTSIGKYAFAGCSGLTSVTIPNSVTSIGSDAFTECTSLTSVTIPNSVTSIGSYAFAGCSGLTSVTIPNSVTSIGNYAFQYCSGLTSVSIGNSVTSIGERAFRYCSGLTSVTIGNSVTSIGSDAFYGCSGLDTIVCKASTPPTLGGSSTFLNVPTSCKVLVPCRSASAYRSAQYWNNFSNFIEQLLFSISISSNDPSQGTAFVSTQPSCSAPGVITATPAHNYHFDSWSDGYTDNPRTITLIRDTSLVAYFQPGNPHFTVHYASMDTLYGVVSEVNPPVAFTSATVGSGTSSTYNSPFNNFYCNSTNECLYLASEIGGAGRIDTISYYVASAYSFACNELKIYMGTTTQTNLSSGWAGFGNLQCVYSRTGITIGRSTGWESYELDTPFEYNGIDNLIVVVCRQSSNYTSSLKYRYSSASNMCRYRQSDSNPSSYGTLSGTATGSTTSERANIRLSMAEVGSTVELAATPKPGYRFFTWSDRCTDNPRSITITQDTSVIAYFSPEPAVEYVHDTTFVDNYIHDTTIVNNYIHDTTILRDTAYVTQIVHDTTIVNNYIHDTTILRDTAYVTQIVHDTTYIPIHDTLYVTLLLRDSTIIYGSHDTIFVHDTVRDCHEQQLFVLVNNDTLGACAGSGSYPLGSTVQIMAIPNRGQRFLCWSDGNTDNPRTITLTGNLTFTAIFLKQEE